MSALATGRPWRRKGGSRRHSFVTLLPLLITFAGRGYALLKITYIKVEKNPLENLHNSDIIRTFAL